MGCLLGDDGELLSSAFDAASTVDAAGPGEEGEETEDSREVVEVSVTTFT